MRAVINYNASYLLPRYMYVINKLPYINGHACVSDSRVLLTNIEMHDCNVLIGYNRP